jgi:hypothetical protein
MDRRWLISRRALLGGVSAAALLSGRRAAAAPAPGGPKRFIVVHVPEGMWSGAPRPVAGAATLGPIFDALDPFRAQVTVLDNLFMKSRDHGPGGDGHHRGVPHMLTGTEMVDSENAGGPSVDQVIAKAIGGASTFQSLQFAVSIVYNDTYARSIWSDASRPVPAMQSPWDAYKRIFASVAAPGAQKPKVDLRRSALDHAAREIAGLRARLPASDRARLDSYQDALRDIERRLAALPAGACAPPSLGGTVDPAAEANVPTIGQLQMDLMVAALQCDLTRVASLQWSNSNDQCAYSWLGVNTLGHDLAHNNGNCDPDGAKKLQVYRWYASQFAYLLGKLRSVPEGSGTMLDNTVVLWASEFGDSNGHAADKLLWTLMGNVAGTFKTGRVIDCGGRSVNDLHTSLCNAYGIGATSYGNPAYCGGALPLT